jgi:DNA-binding transcriptional ArsR family regulator
VDVFRAIADPTRRAMIDQLRGGDLTASELADPYEMSRPAVSQHLRVLLETGLVEVRREGRQRVYGLTAEPLKNVFDWVAHYAEFWPERLRELESFLDRTE